MCSVDNRGTARMGSVVCQYRADQDQEATEGWEDICFCDALAMCDWDLLKEAVSYARYGVQEYPIVSCIDVPGIVRVFKLV